MSEASSRHNPAVEKFSIRKATRDDGAAMMELIRELALYENAPQEVTVSLDTFLECGFGERPVWWAYVAGVKGEVVGFALYHIRYSTWKGPRLYLEDIIITGAWRGKGIGKMLFDKMIEEAREKGLNGVVWQVLDWNKPAINFYEKYDSVKFDGAWLNGSIDF